MIDGTNADLTLKSVVDGKDRYRTETVVISAEDKAKIDAILLPYVAK